VGVDEKAGKHGYREADAGDDKECSSRRAGDTDMQWQSKNNHEHNEDLDGGAGLCACFDEFFCADSCCDPCGVDGGCQNEGHRCGSVGGHDEQRTGLAGCEYKQGKAKDAGHVEEEVDICHGAGEQPWFF